MLRRNALDTGEYMNSKVVVNVSVNLCGYGCVLLCMCLVGNISISCQSCHISEDAKHYIFKKYANSIIKVYIMNRSLTN